jgi:hypothetical protein
LLLIVCFPGLLKTGLAESLKHLGQSSGDRGHREMDVLECMLERVGQWFMAVSEAGLVV